ncbi:glycolate oxidase subunit GlcF [Prosthecodimorpha staleyi]|uniref:Glycolate oxidase iron-sulfur subunit n=1 Tax=Prosthecodimorpha staleyi TaxID=2840188 RepID=A0A947GEH0_9HYPH|nr:glycolate oxidase subunit GlcF [Prosthecodimorpha staleyi]MBT9289355.1 glycolate oxidase subunit GlcF [Prosthecodimorpha staleyi]
MKTNFTPAQLADPGVAEAESILRKCVHCGFCTATCPTFALLGDELDSPRGRIYLIKEMLENDRPADAETVKHVDRCLSCLSCMTTCPSGVNYMHLVDHARAHIEKTWKRPLAERMLRGVLAAVLPTRTGFRAALLAAFYAKPFAGLLKFVPGIGPKLAAMLALAPSRMAGRSAAEAPGVHGAAGERRARVALLTGCAQPVLKPGINEATIRLLTRLGVEVVVPKGEGCCGALVHHMGQEERSHAQAARNVEAWWRETREGGGAGLDAIVITASGCGTTVKDYGFMFRNDPVWKDKAAAVSALARDVSELLVGLDLPARAPNGIVVAYHSACSMQHGQKIRTEPKSLLQAAGFTVRDVPEGHLCCGSAGTYNILQPEIATRLRDRKVANIEKTAPDLIATGNIGCMTQIAGGTAIPIVHTVELLDWVHGGPMPEALEGRLPASMAAAE